MAVQDRVLGLGYMSAKNAALLTPSNAVFCRVKCFHMLFNVISRGSDYTSVTIVKFTQLCSKFQPTALLNFACDWLAFDRDISLGRLTSPNV